MKVLERLRDDRPLLAVELRPPRTGLSSAESMDTWIDMYHSLRGVAARDTLIFLTDNAVGAAEEENLRHLTTNLAGDVSATKLVPILTAKHSLEYCLMYAARAASQGFEALTVLGGDRTVGPPRCVEYAYLLRERIRARVPTLALGGWANPHRDPSEQVAFLARSTFAAEFYLTQVVSHHNVRAVENFLVEVQHQDVGYPGVFGVFLYRSANARTLDRLRNFFPVPAEQITREFESGLAAEEICARSIRALRAAGVQHVYVSNLGYRKADQRYERLLDAVG